MHMNNFISCRVNIGHPYADEFIERNMSPLKFYYDLGRQSFLSKSKILNYNQFCLVEILIFVYQCTM